LTVGDNNEIPTQVATNIGGEPWRRKGNKKALLAKCFFAVLILEL